jgi:methionine-rich copper-binding protein CopC
MRGMARIKRPLRILAALALGAAALCFARPALAQPVLISADPRPGAVFAEPPDAVTLTFDRALAAGSTEIVVTGPSGERFDEGSVQIDLSSTHIATVGLMPLPEGEYTVAYRAASIGSSTFLAGSYTFSVDLPEPTLMMLQPLDGGAFAGPDVPLQFAVQYFDFGLYDDRIQVFVDGEPVEELRGLETTVGGLEPGVHQIGAVLMRFDDEVVPGTFVEATIAIAQPDAEAMGRGMAAAAPPDPGLQLSSSQWGLVGLATLVLLGIGVWLGRVVRGLPPD